MADVIQLAVDTVQDRHPASKKVIIQSDNASGFSSQELIPFILNMNTILYDEENAVLIILVFTKAHTGKTLLDNHYSFIDKNSKHLWRMTMKYSLKMIF